MTQEEINDYNRRCAEFLGWKNLNDDSFPEYLNHLGDFYPLKNLVFHSDWNWIMYVIEAIEMLFDGDVLLEISDESCYIGYHKEYGNYTTMDTKIEAVVQAINQFLIWYNENKTN